MMRQKTVAIVLAGGMGTRMKSDTPKQYIKLGDKPLIYHSLKAFEDSSVDQIILVVGKGEIDYNKEYMIKKYGFNKITKIVEGGLERYDSVYYGLKAISSGEYVLIHDGARPFITVEIIERALNQVKLHPACVVGMPSKDTIKMVNDKGTVSQTLDRSHLWVIQTPQAFSYSIIMEAYKKIMKELESLSDNKKNLLNITDDAMVVEHVLQYPIKLIEGSYFNIKITTPEDLIIGNSIFESIHRGQEKSI